MYGGPLGARRSVSAFGRTNRQEVAVQAITIGKPHERLAGASAFVA